MFIFSSQMCIHIFSKCNKDMQNCYKTDGSYTLAEWQAHMKAWVHPLKQNNTLFSRLAMTTYQYKQWNGETINSYTSIALAHNKHTKSECWLEGPQRDHTFMNPKISAFKNDWFTYIHYSSVMHLQLLCWWMQGNDILAK